MKTATAQTAPPDDEDAAERKFKPKHKPLPSVPLRNAEILQPGECTCGGKVRI